MKKIIKMDERIGEMQLPQAVVARILKDEEIVASKESRETISRAAAVFLLNLSGIACQCAKDNKHKTVTAEDVLRALKRFENDTIYSQCKQAVDEWTILKEQKNLSRKIQENNTNDVEEIIPETPTNEEPME